MKIYLNIIILILSFGLGAHSQTVPNTTRIITKKTESRLGKNALHIEVLGRSFLYGIGYDRMISDEVAIGASFSYLMLSFNPAVAATKAQIFSLPIYTNYYFTTGQHRLLATGGINLFVFDARANLTDAAQAEINKAQASAENLDNGADSTPFVMPNLELSGSGLIPIPQVGIGYEYRARNGFLASTNLYGMYALGQFIPWAGLSVGVAF